MKKPTKTGNKSADRTAREKASLERFGCAFNVGKKAFFIDWSGKTADQASAADIFANFGSVETKAGPLLVLAFAISVRRPLPSYCYFPFDLRNQLHLKYVTQLTRTGEIKLVFVAGKSVVCRTHQLGAYDLSRATGLLDGAKQRLDRDGTGAYDFESAVRLLEQGVRVSEFVERLISESDFAKILKHVRDEARLVPAEKREVAQTIVREALRSFQPYFETNKKFVLGNWFNMRRGLLAVADLHRLFANNPEHSWAEFLSDAIAATFSPEDLDKSKEWIEMGRLLLLLPSLAKPAPKLQDSMTIPQLPVGLYGIFAPLEEGHGISQDSLRRLAELLDFPIGGKSGRPTKDYSREYDRRVAGDTWSQIAQWALENDEDLRKEFGGSGYSSLDFYQKETLKHRITEGVKNYAKRTGRPLPPQTLKDSDALLKDRGAEK